MIFSILENTTVINKGIFIISIYFYKHRLNRIIPFIIIAIIGIFIVIAVSYVVDYNNKLGPYLHSLENLTPLPDGSFPNSVPEISPTFS